MFRPTRNLEVKSYLSENQWPMIKVLFNAIVLVERSDNETSQKQLHAVFMHLYHLQKHLGCLSSATDQVFDEILALKYITPTQGRVEKALATLKELCFSVLKEVCVALIYKHPKEMYLRLLHAYIMFGRMNSKWRAVYELESIMSTECPVIIKLSAVRLMSLIEHEAKEFEIYSSQNLGVDASKILTRQKIFEDLQELFRMSCETNQLFWDELTEKKPSANKLQELGFQIAKSNDQIGILMKESNNSDATQGLRVLLMYGEYLRLVANEPEESKRYLQKVGNISQSVAVTVQFDNDKRLKNLENLNPCIMIVSGDLKTMGTILEANNEAQMTLQRMKSELVGENVSSIMPKIYSDYHDLWMKRYFTTNTDKSMNREMKVFARGRQGFCIQINMLIKIIPEISEGIKIVGVFTELRHRRSDAIMLINLDTGQLVGITKECYSLFGVHPSLCYGVAQNSAPLNVLQVFPQVASCHDLTLERQQATTEQVELDTTALGSLILASRSEIADLGLPPPIAGLFKIHVVRLMPKPVQRYESVRLNILELEIEDTINEVERRGSKTGTGILAVSVGNAKMVQDIMHKVAPRQEKTVHPIDDDDDDQEVLDLNKDLTEAQIEEMNMRAERERKLKEHRQFLKTRKVPNQIVMVYLVSLVALLTGFTGHSTSLVLKEQVLTYFSQNVDSAYIMSQRSSLVSLTAFYAAKLRYSAQ